MTKPVSTFAPEQGSARGKLFIAAAVGVSIAALAGFWFGTKQLTNHLLGGEAMEEGRNWAVYLGHNLPRLPTIVGKKKPQDNERRIIESARRAAGIVRFRFLAPDGRIIYSSVIKEIGNTVTDGAFAASIANRVVVGAVTKDVDASGAKVVYRTAYVPILEKKTIAGVIEASSDVTARAARLDLLALFATLGLSAVMLAIIVLMAMGGRKRPPPVALVRPKASPSAKPDNAAISQAVNRVLALVRLEMRTPLSGINAMANQLRGHGAVETFPALAGALYRSSNAVLGLMDTISDPSPRASDDSPVAFKIKEVVADAIDLLVAPAEAKKIHLIDVVSDRLAPTLMGNPEMLTQLLICAVNHGIGMVENGKLLVEVDAGDVPGTHDAVEFALAYSGAAGPKAGAAGDPSVLRRLVTRLGGELLSDGSDGKLPRFIMALPAADRVPREEAPAPPPSLETPGHGDMPPATPPATPFDVPEPEEMASPSPPAPSFETPDPEAMAPPPPPEEAPGAGQTEFASIAAPTLDISTLAALRDEQSGRPGLVERVIANYLEQSPVSLRKLADGVQRGNAPLVQMAANRLKTSSSNIGAARLAELCEIMEQRARSSQLDSAEPLMSEIAAEFTQVEEALGVGEPEEGYSSAGF